MHRQVPVVRLVREQTGSDHVLHRLRAIATHQVERNRKVVRDSPDEGHHAHKDVPSLARDPDELGRGLLPLLDDVTERASVTNGCIEGGIRKPPEVRHVRDHALANAFLEPFRFESFAVELELLC